MEALGVQVDENRQAVLRLESAAAAREEASSLLRRTSSSGSSKALEALQGHLLSQQQRLQAQMEALAAGIKQGIPGTVSSAVGEASKVLERRLAERAASRQELAALTAKVGRSRVRGMVRVAALGTEVGVQGWVGAFQVVVRWGGGYGGLAGYS